MFRVLGDSGKPEVAILTCTDLAQYGIVKALGLKCSPVRYHGIFGQM